MVMPAYSTAPPSEAAAAPRQPVLVAKGLGMRFGAGQANAVEAFRDIAFELRQREILAIVGPSGCGKSTLFNVIAGLIEPTDGDVWVQGARVSGAHGHVGYMLQKDLLLPWRSVVDNIVLGLEVRGMPRAQSVQRARALVSAFGLEGFENARPGTLSGGMRQRVAFMRTLAFDPDVILLDEPFSALDFQTRLVLQKEVMRIIQQQGKSAILVTHDIGEAITMADRVIVLTHRPGRIRNVHDIELPGASRDPVEIRRLPEYQRYFETIWQELEVTTNL